MLLKIVNILNLLENQGRTCWRRELTFTHPLENVTELIVLGEQLSSASVDKLLKFRYLSSFPSDYVPTHDNDTFAIINTQPSNMQGEHWITIANFRHELYFAVYLGCKRYSFFNNNQHYKQMMPAPLLFNPSLCDFYTTYAAFHFFKFQQEEIAGVHDVNVLSFINIYMFFSLFVC